MFFIPPITFPGISQSLTAGGTTIEGALTKLLIPLVEDARREDDDCVDSIFLFPTASGDVGFNNIVILF